MVHSKRDRSPQLQARREEKAFRGDASIIIKRTCGCRAHVRTGEVASNYNNTPSTSSGT